MVCAGITEIAAYVTTSLSDPVGHHVHQHSFDRPCEAAGQVLGHPILDTRIFIPRYSLFVLRQAQTTPPGF